MLPVKFSDYCRVEWIGHAVPYVDIATYGTAVGNPGFAASVGVGFGSFVVANITDFALPVELSLTYELLIYGETGVPPPPSITEFALAGAGVAVALTDPTSDLLDQLLALDLTVLLDNVLDLPSAIPGLDATGVLGLASPTFFIPIGPVMDSETVYIPAGGAVQFSLLGISGGAAAGNPIPEPSTIVLFGSGLIGLVGWRMRKQTV